MSQIRTLPTIAYLILFVLASTLSLAECRPSTDAYQPAPIEATKTEPADSSADRNLVPTVHPSLENYQSTNKTLTICLAEEPASLYILSEKGMGWRHIQEALRDGPFDKRTFGYQPVILEKMPYWDDGDVWITPVTVQPEERMVASDGTLVRLEPGIRYWTTELRQATAVEDKAITTIQMHVKFRLRHDVLWSDGEVLTASDSVFGFQVKADDDTPTDKSLAWRTADYTAVGARTVEWTGLSGYLNHDYAMSFAEPLPMHVYGHLSAADLLIDQQANRQPLGWGAFRMMEWVDGSYLRLERNEHYFRGPDGLPYLDEVRFVFAETEDEAISQLSDGVCQVAVRNQWDAWETHVDALMSAQSTGKLATQFVPSTMLEHIDFGIMPTADYRRATGNEFFQSVDTRIAVAHCIDRQRIADAVQWGKGEVAHSYVPADHPLYGGDTLSVYPFDPDQGRALLTAAGWEDQNGLGVRSRDGVPLILRYHANFPRNYSGRLRKTIAELIQSDLHVCGIEVVIESTSAEEMYAEWPDGVVFGRKFDLAEYAWLLPGEPRCELYRSNQIPRNGFLGGINSTGYSSPAFDAACDQAFSALNRAQRLQSHQLAQQIFSAELPSLPLFFRLRIGVARPELRGFQLDTTHPSPLWNIEAFDLVYEQ